MVLPWTVRVVVVTVTPDPLVVATECVACGPVAPAVVADPVAADALPADALPAVGAAAGSA
jgi:hypothetical protein